MNLSSNPQYHLSANAVAHVCNPNVWGMQANIQNLLVKQPSWIDELQIHWKTLSQNLGGEQWRTLNSGLWPHLLLPAHPHACTGVNAYLPPTQTRYFCYHCYSYFIKSYEFHNFLSFSVFWDNINNYNSHKPIQKLSGSSMSFKDMATSMN